MSVEVVIKRKFVEEKAGELGPLMVKLRSLARSQPGYISSESLKCVYPLGDYDYFIRSKWKSIEDCYVWLNSQERSRIQQRIDTITGVKNEYRIYEPLADGIFDK